MGRRSSQPAPKVKKSRTRSGCFTCRDRHMKCDEQLPVCQNCINSKRKCFRGIRLNFSQYVIYNPRPSGFWSDMPTPRYYRILDQSIAVAKLYKNGFQGYRKYRHLHTSKDLVEAEQILLSDLQSNAANPPNLDLLPNVSSNADLMLQQDDLSQFFDTWLYTGQTLDVNSSQTMRNRIQENDDIKRILMNPELHDKQLGGVMQAAFHQKISGLSERPKHRKPRYSAATAPELHMIAEDADGFIRLIHHQKFFWLLDLFNDLRIWESCIPSYCVRLYQASKPGDARLEPDEKFLFRCLLLSDERTSADRIIDVTQLQTQRWREFEKKDITFTSFQAFEGILISVVLILQSILVKSTCSEFTADLRIAMLLENEGRLIHKLAARFKRVPASLLKRLGDLTFTIASFQAIGILRFFLKMIFRKSGAQVSSRPSSSGLMSFDSDFSLVLKEHHDLSIFFTLTESEVSLLCNNYSGFDLTLDSLLSDAAKLRAQFWELVLCEYQIKTGVSQIYSSADHESEPHSEEAFQMHGSTSALIPNARCLALRILSLYHQKISGASAMHTSFSSSLLEIFQKIQDSAMHKDIKEKWLLNFDWSNSR